MLPPDSPLSGKPQLNKMLLIFQATVGSPEMSQNRSETRERRERRSSKP